MGPRWLSTVHRRSRSPHDGSMRRSARRVWPHRSTDRRRYTGRVEPATAGGPKERRVPEAQVITVTGPRDAATLGVVDAHDHLLMDSPGLPGQGFTDVE